MIGARRLPRAPAVLSLALASLCWLSGAGARAEIPLIEGDALSLGFGGYARTLSGVLRGGVDGPGLPGTLGLSQSILRLEWRLRLGELATFELHDRLSLTLTSGVGAAGATEALGVGVTPAPARSVDLRSTLVDDGAGTLLEHDLDRLALRLFLGDWDISLGRQAITWGTANIFTVADCWAAFSPFDLDTSQKRGIDALRVSRPLGELLSLELVVADRGSLADLSAGLRLSAFLDAVDLYLAVAKQWSELALLAGVSWPLGQSKLRAEAWGAWDSEREELLRPRVTLGWDWFGEGVTLSVEAHYNGAGVARADAYLSHRLSAPEYERGEVFLLGRTYLGAALSWEITPQLRLVTSVMGNLLDPSALIVTSLRYDIAESVDLSFGAMDGLGSRNDLSTGALSSELGAYGHLFFMQLSAYL